MPEISRRTALSLLAPACCAFGSQKKRLEVRGMYADPEPFWAKGAKLPDYGVNALFVRSVSIKPETMARASAEGARVYAEFPTLNGGDYVKKHPEAWPIDERGERSPQATWFLGACPTEPAFRAFRMKQLDDLLDRFDLAGIWLDYFHWHAQFEDPKPILPETCFSPTCLAAFQKSAGIRIPEGSTPERARWILTRHDAEWRNWRVSQLVDWAKEAKARIRAKRPGALLGIYHCAWTDEEYGGARRRTLGLDLEQLAKVADVLSPMVYHGRKQRLPEWVGEYVEWISGRVGKQVKIWPIVQAHSDSTHKVTAEEFEQVLRAGTRGSATGVMMFTAASVASDPGKMEAMRRVFVE